MEPEEREQVLALVERVFAEQGDGLSRTHLIEHRIRLNNSEPVRHKYLRISLHVFGVAGDGPRHSRTVA